MDKKFSKKKVAVLGFGMEGQDLAQFLLSQEAEITIFDQKEANELGEIYERFKKLGCQFELGKESLKKLPIDKFDFVFRSPGFSPLRPEIITAQKEGTIISSATKIFFDLCPGKIIGITGTKGKGTTSTLVYKILKEDKKQVFLAGNVGQPMLALLPQIKKGDWVILELSSFQLQDLDKSPHLAVVLFIVPEHLDYHQDTKEYIQAKSNIVRHQSKDDLAVLNANDLTSSSFASLTPAQIYCFSRQKKVNGAFIKDQKIYLFDQEVGPTDKLQLLGEHNWDNVCAAVLTAHLAGASLESIRKVVFAFQGLEHRLEKVAVIKEVAFYNDSFSTTPETTIAAIKSFKKPLVLIAGGSEKGSDYHNLGREIRKSSVKTLILIGQMADRIKQAVLRAGFQGEIIFRPSEKMAEIVKLAFEKSNPSEVVLLSPACASFDLFVNYKDRGLQFKKYVKAL
jgi:UDP-N-acetylmuramoylalanine--D-glutamate ligase